MSAILGVLGAGMIGLLLAYAELLARYRDNPIRAIWSAPAFVYALVNACTGLLAAWWILTFARTMVAPASSPPAAPPDSAVDAAKLAMIAGFGALAVLRASLLKLRMNSGEDISVGPAVIIEQLLSVVDRSVDRHLAKRRSRIASELAVGFAFNQQSTSLVSLCLTLLQNPSPTETQQMTSVRNALAGRHDLSQRVKTMSLMLTLLELVGESVLREAVAAIRAEPDERRSSN
jgi:hypothetical protein